MATNQNQNPTSPAAVATPAGTPSPERLLRVLRGPLNSEKSSRIADKRNQYAFVVESDATKREIKAAVELVFKVQVTGVQVLHVKGKVRRFRQKEGRTKSWKKAYVSLPAGQEISFVN